MESLNPQSAVPGLPFGEPTDPKVAIVWLEMQAMAWNRPELQTRLQDMNRQWRTILTDAYTRAINEYGSDTDGTRSTLPCRWSRHSTSDSNSKP